MAGIYIHIPFCKQACNYCDFHFSTSVKKRPEMVKAICQEISIRKNEINEPIKTIYFGGGTPSLLSVEEINLILNACYENYEIVNETEITLEANPDDLSIEKLNELSQTKINRLSIGVQSFFEQDLQLMNRAHNSGEAENCILEAKKYFDNISIDLIYGIPEMSNQRWEENLQKSIDLQVPHISCYALTVEPKTALEHQIKTGKVKPVSGKKSREHYDILQEKMIDAGFVNYEFSNFGKEGFYSQNNLAYWFGKPYLGIGPSAHSFVYPKRSWNVANNTRYLKALSENKLPQESETLSVTDSYNEYVMTRFRTIWGVNFTEIKEKFGEKYSSHFLESVKNFLEKGVLIENAGNFVIAQESKFLSDGIAAELFFV
ncbi:radical SAM family heme chaperone HemW [Mesonia sp. K7]|uniref:radical SAM family heme chaperone HemW n=1 Tax=Mesonia sp. K7 TaxID=2218606 RepID=UPI000DA76F92|nr:radical SAM family heme chaperone HemW [Mesonia sp. K7]PZD76501.1 coproporphyrinogen III oxidase [Mesonia sp. K7]